MEFPDDVFQLSFREAVEAGLSAAIDDPRTGWHFSNAGELTLPAPDIVGCRVVDTRVRAVPVQAVQD